jgi:hypothetical protein
MARLLFTLMTASALAAPGATHAGGSWPDSRLGRVEALAVIETLNGQLLASRSATATLEAWCAGHHMAQPARISAQLARGADKPVTDEQRRRLRVGPDEPIAYRHVRLACGGQVLSEADNWYVPGRLTPEMNRLLNATDTPFGKAVAGVHPTRQTLGVERLWSPLPPDWDMAEPPHEAHARAALDVPASLFRHRAILLDDQRRPIAEVVETYTGEILDFPRPAPP